MAGEGEQPYQERADEHGALAIPPPPPPAPPPVSLAAPDESTVVRRTGSRARLVVGAGLVVALGIGAIAVVVARDEAPDADAALAGAQRVAEGAESYRFEQLQERRSVTGDPQGAGSDTTTRTLLTGAIAGPEQWRLSFDAGDELMDVGEMVTVRIDDVMYSSGYMTSGSTGPAWTATPVLELAEPGADELHAMYEDLDLGGEDDPWVDEMRLDAALQAYLSEGALTDPAGMLRVVTAAVDPQVVEERADGGLLLRAQLPPSPEALEAIGDELPSVELTLQLDDVDRPILARFTVSSGTASADVELTLLDWDAPVRVDPPAESDIDRTPWISEEDLARVDPSLLLAPTLVPTGLHLVSASTYADSFDAAFGDAEGCPSVDLSYATEASMQMDPEDVESDEWWDAYDDLPYLDVSVIPSDCSGDLYGDGYFDTELAGFPATGEDGYWDVQLGGVVVTLSTSLPVADLEPVVASLAPVTIDQLAAAIPTWVIEVAESGYGFGGLPMAGWSSGAMLSGF